MDNIVTTRDADSDWPHRLAVALVCATFPLIWVGALVTTEGAGMAVPDWPTTYGYNMFLYPWTTWLFGPWDLFIEHGHRLLASFVGLLTIALLVVFLLREPRIWVRWLGVVALLLVCGQGVLGGMRVLLDEVLLAKLHGCLGPLFFAVCVAIACVTSRWWRQAQPAAQVAGAGTVQGGAVVLTLLAYLQLVLGAQLRHVAAGADHASFQAAVWGHVIMAFVLLGYAFILAVTAKRRLREFPSINRPAMLLATLVTLQILLGAASWVMKYSVPGPLQSDLTARWTNTAGSMISSLIITSHVAIGSLILVAALMIALRAWRLVQRPTVALTVERRLAEVHA